LEGHEQAVHSVTFSPDGQFALSGSEDETLRLWKVSPFMGPRLHAPWFYSKVISAQEALERERSHETYLARAQQAFEADRIADALALLKQARAVSGFDKSHDCLNLQARVGARARVKSYGGGWLKRTLEGHTGGVNSLALSPDGCFALSGSEDKTLRLWDVAGGKCVRTFEGIPVQSIPSRCPATAAWPFPGAMTRRFGCGT
jgi:WD40 repeat protein